MAARFNQTDWRLVYQSRSGRPEDPWLEPDVAIDISKDFALRDRDVLLIPVGFLMDHVEVLFDLDVKAREAAESVQARYHRAKTVGLQGHFLDMLKDRVLDQFEKDAPVQVPGPMPRSGPRVVVVGGGLSGLLGGSYRVWEHFHASGREVNLTVLGSGGSARRRCGNLPTGRVLLGRRAGQFHNGKAAALALARRLALETQVIGTNKEFQQVLWERAKRSSPPRKDFIFSPPQNSGLCSEQKFSPGLEKFEPPWNS